MKEDTDLETIFNIAMGAVGGKQITQQHRICMDDIVLEKIKAPEIKPEETGKNLLTNGDFSNGWDINANADQTATTVVTDGGIVFQVKNPGEKDWDVQLKQTGFTLEKGCKYRVKFKVTSTKARTIKLGLMDNSSQKWYGGADISLGEAEEKEVSYEFTMQQDTDNVSEMFISMGKISDKNTPASDITLTNFSLEKITE